MYYTIEGKKFLLVLYLSGLFLGSVMMNLAVRMHLFEEVSLFQFVTYLKEWDMHNSSFFSYILFVRLRQLIIFFVFLLIFSPYLVFCVLDFAFSLLAGGFITCAVMYYGSIGMVKGMAIFFPHGICYLAAFGLIYLYLFKKTPAIAMYRPGGTWLSRIIRPGFWLKYRTMVAVCVILLFIAGCYMESSLSPLLLRRIG